MNCFPHMRGVQRMAVLALLALLATACTGGSTVAPTAPTGPAPTKSLRIDSPTSGSVVPTTFELTGQIVSVPPDSRLNYRIIDSNERIVGAAAIPVAGNVGQPGRFAAVASYTSGTVGAGRVEVYRIDTASGTITEIDSVRVNFQNAVVASPTTDTGVSGNLPTAQVQPTGVVATNQPLPTAPVQPTGQVLPTIVPTAVPIPQTIVFDSPPPGTLVGSPVVVSGRVARFPANGRLSYRFYDSANRPIGLGDLPVTGAPGQAATFNASLTFNPPAQGGDIRLEVSDIDQASGRVEATAVLSMFVAPPQQITIETPPAGVFVGSPVVLTGRLARLPFDNNLAYRIVDQNGRELGTGLIEVNGTPGRPTTFNGSLTFRLPLDGGNITAELIDQDGASGAIASRASIALRVQPTPQAISFDGPPPGTLVGSPMVISGRTTRYPADGKLVYNVFAADGRMLGNGAFGVGANQDGGSNWKVSINFALPDKGGPIRLQMVDQATGSGVPIASASLDLAVAPPAPPPQNIVIETPIDGTLVGSPVVITGRADRAPEQGYFQYRVRRMANNEEVAQGSFRPTMVQPTRFNQTIYFPTSPTGGQVVIEVFEVDGNSGVIVAADSVVLNTSPAVPTTPSLPATPTTQQLIIESPPANAVVQNGFVIAGRAALYPNRGQIFYEVYDQDNQLIGSGNLRVNRQTAGATFSGQVIYNLRAMNTPIRVVVLDRNDQAATIASAQVVVIAN